MKKTCKLCDVHLQPNNIKGASRADMYCEACRTELEAESKKNHCKHPTIVMANTTGKPITSGGYEVDFLIRCHDCNEELFRTSEYGREIINLSKH